MNRERYRYIFLCLLCSLFSFTLYAQRTITGVIFSSDDKEPLIGASVTVSDTQLKNAGADVKHLGVVTDLDGNFTLKLPAGISEIECRMFGYNPRTIHLVEGVDHYDLTLDPSAQMLNDVVVTGYQAIERRKLTASITKVELDENQIGSIMNIDQALAGQVAGLSALQTSGSPGTPLKIRIRGTSSLQGTQDPLWVIDGVPMNGTEVPSTDELKDIDNLYQSSIAGISPSDIESITVLKDAAATAIYGTRAANGVIVITTKSGKQGKPQVSFSTRLSYAPKPDISRLNLLNSSEKVDLELDLLRSNFTYRENKGAVARLIAAANLTEAYKQGGWNALTPSVQQQINALRYINTDWNDILFRDTFSQEYNLSISGGGDKSTYYTSLGYQEENGTVPGVSANRFNLVLKTNYRLSEKFKVGAALFVNRRKTDSYLTDNDGFTNPVYYSRRANPYQQPYDANGDYIYDTDIQGREDSDLKFNIFEERANTDYTQETTGLTALLDADLRLTDYLKAVTQIGFQMDHVDTQSFASGETYAMRKEFYRTEVMGTDGIRKSFLPAGGRHIQSKSTSKQINWKAQIEFSKRLAPQHELEVMAGTEIRKTWYDYFSSTAYGYDRKTLTSKPVIFPNESWARTFPLHTESVSENAYASFYGTTSYSLLRRYTFGASVRWDGSDLFGVDKKYRFLPLYSGSALWRISDEPWMKNSMFNNLALRLSYGIQGNIDKSTSSYVMGDYNNTSILPGVVEDVIVLGTPPNRRLRWEKTHTANIGLDMGLFDNAINLSVDGYYRKGNDLIALKMLPLETGFMSTMVNWASMRNRGIEFALSTRNISNKNFRWTTNFNIAYNENTVLQETVPFNQTTPSREGYPVNAIFAYRTAGLDEDGYPLFLNAKGEKVTAKEFLKLNAAGASTLSAEEQRNLYTYIGSGDPLWTGGFINNFYYRDFDLSVNFAFNLKMYTRIQPPYSSVWFDRGMNTNREILDRWTPDNPTSSLPALMPDGYRTDERTQYGEFTLYSMMDSWVKRSDYVRLQSVILGYNVPTPIVAKMGMTGIRVAFEARNLCVFGANYKNFLDPETMGNPFAQPIPKSYTFNLQVKF